jgi:hypothetical protein
MSPRSALVAVLFICVGLTVPAGADGAALRWKPPSLTNPVRVHVTNARPTLWLDSTKDYIVEMANAPITATGGVSITGGHNVVLIGGHISIPWQGAGPAPNSRRGLYLKNQTGIVHVEGVLIDGSDLGEGIDLDQRKGSTVQIENVRILGIHARDEVGFSDTHPDVIQTWGGPAVLRIDRFIGTTDYQGFYLDPTQYDKNADIRLADFRNVDITGTPTSAYLLWQATPFPMRISNVWIRPAARMGNAMWPSASAWPGVSVGTAAVSRFARGSVAGTTYRSPGYTR